MRRCRSIWRNRRSAAPTAAWCDFEIDAHRKHCLLNGLDDIGLTMVKEGQISDFEAKAKTARPWV